MLSFANIIVNSNGNAAVPISKNFFVVGASALADEEIAEFLDAIPLVDSFIVEEKTVSVKFIKI